LYWWTPKGDRGESVSQDLQKKSESELQVRKTMVNQSPERGEGKKGSSERKGGASCPGGGHKKKQKNFQEKKWGVTTRGPRGGEGHACLSQKHKGERVTRRTCQIGKASFSYKTSRGKKAKGTPVDHAPNHPQGLI